MLTPAPWRLAQCLVDLRAQIDAVAPGRSKKSDGGVADQRHVNEAKRTGKGSDHIPNAAGVVTAIDVTNDPQHEVHAAVIAESIRASRDGRVRYLIFNHFICRSYVKPGIPAWTWSAYAGANPHDKHLHISVNAADADDTASPWRIAK